MHYQIYTDGAYSSSRNQGGIGIAIVKDGNLIYSYDKAFIQELPLDDKKVTNIRMELLAVIFGLRCVKKAVSSLTIITDSQYVLGGITKNWKHEACPDLWFLFNLELKRVKTLCPNISYEWTKGHADNKWNNLCDKLAQNASQRLL